jgi:hypothetical protein
MLINQQASAAGLLHMKQKRAGSHANAVARIVSEEAAT